MSGHIGLKKNGNGQNQTLIDMGRAGGERDWWHAVPAPQGDYLPLDSGVPFHGLTLVFDFIKFNSG